MKHPRLFFFNFLATFTFKTFLKEIKSVIDKELNKAAVDDWQALKIQILKLSWHLLGEKFLIDDSLHIFKWFHLYELIIIDHEEINSQHMQKIGKKNKLLWMLHLPPFFIYFHALVCLM